ncbi:MAG: carotenoid oxygenase family protein [Pararobbsia sp.]
MRNGPNPLHPDPSSTGLRGHGMVHRFEFANGSVTYRNRWVRTQRWHSEREGGAAELRGPGTAASEGPAFDDGVANTNVLMHGRRLLALEEAHLPIELDAATLGTRGQVDFRRCVAGRFHSSSET